MPLSALDQLICDAIHDYLKDTKDRTQEIKASLVNRLPPPGLEELIKSALTQQINKEKNQEIRDLYKYQQETQTHLLNSKNMTLEQVKTQLAKDNIALNQLMDKLNNLYEGNDRNWNPDEINALHDQMGPFKANIIWLKNVLALGTPTRNCKKMKDMLIPYNREAYYKTLGQIKNQYDYDVFSEDKLLQIFNVFAQTLIPQIQSNPDFTVALQYYVLENKRQDILKDRKKEILFLLDEKIAELEAQDEDKKHRVLDFKARIEDISISIQTMPDDFVRQINTWRFDEYKDRSNLAAFKPSALAKFFSCHRDEGKFIRACMVVATARLSLHQHDERQTSTQKESMQLS